MGKGKKTLAAARTDPLSRGMAVDPFDENRCCNCGTPPAGTLFRSPPPLMSERAKCPHLVVRDPRTVERGRLLCVVLCMLQFGLHKHNYCCAYLLSLSLSFSHLHTRSTDFVQVGLVTGIVVVALMCAVVVLAGGYVTPPH